MSKTENDNSNPQGNGSKKPADPPPNIIVQESFDPSKAGRGIAKNINRKEKK
ncbi:MAG: hypothetical protein ACLQUW_11670 [Desulfobaccales bacterium]